MGAAHGFASATGRARAVLAPVECGTQALDGAMHNAAKGRIPIFIFTGASPVTQDGEIKGSRSEFIQWIQGGHDQRGSRRDEGEVRSSSAMEPLVGRAFQFAPTADWEPNY
jgi:acetolactate synthase-1/2/3 large subunit